MPSPQMSLFQGSEFLLGKTNSSATVIHTHTHSDNIVQTKNYRVILFPCRLI